MWEPAGAASDPMLDTLLEGLLEEWEQAEHEDAAGPAPEPSAPEFVVEASAVDAALEAEPESTHESPEPKPEPVPAPVRTAPAPDRGAERREGILRLLAAMYPDAAAHLPGRAGSPAAPAEPRPAGAGHVVFRLGGENFALAIAQVVEADRVPPATPAPFVPEFLRGIANRRGEVLPVIDLRLLLGLDASLEGRMLVVRRGEGAAPAALVVDSLAGIAWLGGLAAVRLTSEVAGRFPGLLRGCAQHRGAAVHVMDVERLFARPELKELEDLAAA